MSTLTDVENSVIDEYFKNLPNGEKSTFRVYTLGGKTAKKCKDRRLAVVSSYRVVVFNRLKMKKEPKAFNLFDIVEISTDVSDVFVFKLKNSKKSEWFIKCEAKAAEFIQAIRSEYQIIAYQYPPQYQMKLTLYDRFLLPLEPVSNVSIANGFLGVYRAFCSLQNIEASQELEHHIQRIVDANSYDLDFTNCPGIESKSDISLNLAPIFSALRFNTYFRGLIIQDLEKRSEIVNLLADVLKFNSHLTKLKLVNISGEEKAFFELGTNLKENKAHSLQILDFSTNHVGNKGMFSIGESLQLWPHSLTSLNLSNCHITDKGITSLAYALDKSYSMSLTLQELILSGNNLGQVGTTVLEAWFANVKSYSNLKKLHLANTNLVLTLLPSIKLLDKIVDLDISGNKVDVDGSILLAYFCEFNSVLKKINLSGSGLAKESLETIVESIIGNVKLSNVDINLSNNDLGNSGYLYLIKIIKTATNISGIDVSDNKMKEKVFVEFLESVKLSKSIEKLGIRHVISKNSVSSEEKTSDITNALISLISENKKIKHIDISNGYGKSIIIPFLTSLQNNSSVQYLDISSNALADKGAEAISQVLRANKTLNTLLMDDNRTTLSGFSALHFALKYNKNLYSFPLPSLDIEKQHKELNQNQYVQFYTILSKICQIIDTNRTGIKFPNEEIATPLTVQPFAEVPDFLKSVRSTITVENISSETIVSSSNYSNHSAESVASYSSTSSEASKTTASPAPVEEKSRKNTLTSTSSPVKQEDPKSRKGTITPASPPPAPAPPPAPKEVASPPPPPPPSSNKGTIGAVPPPPAPPPAPKVSENEEDPEERSALLSGIRGFNSKGLKKTVTNDRSAPVMKEDKGNAGGSGGLMAEIAAKKKKT